MPDREAAAETMISERVSTLVLEACEQGRTDDAARARRALDARPAVVQAGTGFLTFRWKARRGIVWTVSKFAPK